jgi:selenocysteine lyase/cysteine desulfurase
VGTINDVKEIAKLAHEVGAKVFLDAVHYAPHGPIDVQDWNCDFLTCSAYKFFGPHIGILWGRQDLLKQLTPYKVRPSSDSLPDRWMTGTQNHECLAGVAAAVDYLTEIGANQSDLKSRFPTLSERRAKLRAAMIAIQDYEAQLAKHLLEELAKKPQFKVWGITSPPMLKSRVPTISITHADHTALSVAEHLASRQIYTWSGNMYALELTERLGLEGKGGLLRIGLVHYNTHDEINRLSAALDEMP